MANNNKKPAKRASKSDAAVEGPKITRISATDNSGKLSDPKPAEQTHKLTSKERADKTTSRTLKKSDNAPSKTEIVEQKAIKSSKKRRNPLAAFFGYFKGAWYELRQVRWPDRPTTWGMTGALIAFTLFFVLIIILLDTVFKALFEFLLS
jgi:preprotein translocase SecE subunit